MSKETIGFKHKLFGGFKQEDVLDYIKDLAKQRSEYHDELDALQQEHYTLEDEKDILEDEVARLRADNSAIHKELDALKKQLEEAENQAKDLTNALDNTIADVKSAKNLFDAPSLKINARVQAAQTLGKCLEKLNTVRADISGDNDKTE